MSQILSLETSTDVCSIALHRNEELVKEIIVSETQAHAEKLAPAISNLLKSLSINFKEIDAVAVTSGPGSYTGLRIGVSTAKGICFAAGIPLITIPTLDLLASQAVPLVPPGALLCPMIDARRMEVYCQVFTTSLGTIKPLEAKVIDEDSFEELLTTRKMFFFGNGADKFRSIITKINAAFLPGIFPKASAMGSMSLKKFRNKEIEDLETFTPLYLKDFVAKKAQPLL